MRLGIFRRVFDGVAAKLNPLGVVNLGSNGFANFYFSSACFSQFQRFRQLQTTTLQNFSFSLITGLEDPVEAMSIAFPPFTLSVMRDSVELGAFLLDQYFSWLLPFCSFGQKQIDFVVRVVVKSGGWWGVSACEIGREGGVCLAVGSCLVC